MENVLKLLKLLIGKRNCCTFVMSALIDNHKTSMVT